MMHAVQRQLKPVGDAQLVVHAAKIVFHYLLRRADLVGDVLVLHALRDTGNDQHFLVGEAVLRTRRGQRRCLRAVSFDDPTHSLVIEPHFAALYLADAANEQVRGDGAIDNAAHATTELIHGRGLVDIAGHNDDFDVGCFLENF